MLKKASQRLNVSAALAGFLLLGGFAGALGGLDAPVASASEDKAVAGSQFPDDTSDHARFGHPENCDFDGKWFSYDLGNLRLDERGRYVTGKYKDGRLQGKVDDDVVKGTWKQHDGDRGQVRLFLDRCDSMLARWRYGHSGPWHEEYFTRN